MQNRDHTRGAWNYDGEADLGNGAIFRMSSTILAKDPLFGWFAYGGKMDQKDKVLSVYPRDGVRNRFWIIDENDKIGIEVNRDGFAKGAPVLYSEVDETVEFYLENRLNDEHKTTLTLKSDDDWELYLDNQKIPLHPTVRKSEEVMEASITVKSNRHNIKLKKNYRE